MKKHIISYLAVIIASTISLTAGELLLHNMSLHQALVRKNKKHTYKVPASTQAKISFASGDTIEISADSYTSSWQAYDLSPLREGDNYRIDITTDTSAYRPSYIFTTAKTSISGIAQQQISLFNEDKISSFLRSYADALVGDSVVQKEYQIRKWIADGGRYAYHILFDADFDVANPDQSIIKTETQQEYFDAILSLMWYFYAEAINKGQKFEQGSFIVQDSQDRLFTFLHSYVKKMNPQSWKTVAGTLGSQNPYGYTRESTHLYDSKEQGSDYNHYGIDARYQGANSSIGSVQYILPIQKSHILFGRVFPRDGNKRVFIKPEDYGLYVADGLPMHGYELGFSVARKIFGGDDAAHYRKERVEKALIARMQQMFGDSRSYLDSSGQKQFLAAVKRYGVQELVRLSVALPNGWLQASIKKYLGELGKQYDHLAWRYGREVILTNIEFISSLYYYLENGGFSSEAHKLKQLLSAINTGMTTGFTRSIQTAIADFDSAALKPYVTSSALGAVRNVIALFSQNIGR